MAKVLVTGANGFIGSHLVEGLLAKGYQVRALVRKTANLQWIKNLPIELVYGTISDYESIKGVVNDIDYVMHVAGTTKGLNQKDYEKGNIQGTANLLKICVEARPRIKRFVFFSTLAAAGATDLDKPKIEDMLCTPVSIYGITKLQAEQLVLEKKDKIPSVILRLSAIYGPRDTEILAIFKFLAKGIRPIFGSANSVCYIKDVVNAGILALEKNVTSGSIYHISDGKYYTIDDVAKIAEPIIGKKTLRVKVPKSILKTYATLTHFFKSGDTVFGPDKVKELTQGCWICDTGKAKRELGFVPKYSLEQGLKETIEWYQEQGWL
jgi:nucleoside-diphosphate-sugar epimerase